LISRKRNAYIVAFNPLAPRQPINSAERGERATTKPTSAL